MTLILILPNTKYNLEEVFIDSKLFKTKKELNVVNKNLTYLKNLTFL